MPSYFDSMIETAMTRQEDEYFENIDQTSGPSMMINVEKLLRKAKVDCLNVLTIGGNA
jgi:hypothetical protein